MLSEIHFIKLWHDMKTTFPDEPDETIVPLFSLEVLRTWGWPYKPIAITDSMPPINQSFLGYFPEIGWLIDFWKEGYTPYPEDMPTHWLSMNVLPTPSDPSEQL